MRYIEWGWHRRHSILLNGVVLVAGLLLAGTAVVAIGGCDGPVVSASTIVTATSASQLAGMRTPAPHLASRLSML